MLKSKQGAFTNRKRLFPALIFLGVIGLVIFAALNPSIIFNLLPRTEFPVQIRFVTSSDWTQVNLASGGKLKDVNISSSSSQATEAHFDGTYLWLRQSRTRADGVATVEMVVDATLINITPGTDLVFQGKRGCIGGTTIEFSNAIVEPVLVKTTAWGNSCSGDGNNLYEFSVPVDLFIK